MINTYTWCLIYEYIFMLSWAYFLKKYFVFNMISDVFYLQLKFFFFFFIILYLVTHSGSTIWGDIQIEKIFHCVGERQHNVEQKKCWRVIKFLFFGSTYQNQKTNHLLWQSSAGKDLLLGEFWIEIWYLPVHFFFSREDCLGEGVGRRVGGECVCEVCRGAFFCESF